MLILSKAREKSRRIKMEGTIALVSSFQYVIHYIDQGCTGAMSLAKPRLVGRQQFIFLQVPCLLVIYHPLQYFGQAGQETDGTKVLGIHWVGHFRD